MKVYQNKKGGWQFNFTLDRRQHQIYLGRNHNAASATRVTEIVKELLLCRFRAERPPVKLMRQIREFDPKLLETIRRHGLLEFHEAGLKLKQLVDQFLSQKVGIKPVTMKAYVDKLKRIRQYFGDDKSVSELTENEAAELKAYLLDVRKLSPVTVGWSIRLFRSMFRFGLKNRLCYENPFDDIGPGPKANDNHYRFIETELIENVLTHCKTTETAFAVRLARYAGLRMPSEIRNMRFQDFGTDGFFVHDNSKTGRREVPFFHELRPDFKMLQQNRNRDDFVFSRQMVCAVNLRSRFLTILNRAAVEPWPRLFNNLRASRITELDEQGFTAKTLDSIFGNTESIRNRHYVGFRRDRAFMLMLGESVPKIESVVPENRRTIIAELVENGGKKSNDFEPIVTEMEFSHGNRGGSLVFS